MKRNVFILVILFLMTETFISETAAQRLIRKSSRHYITQLGLPDKVEPLLKDVWDQYAPNNNFCPMDSTGERCVVGCIATAMTQVMNYWKWPVTGRGSHTYTDSTGCKQTLTANFSEHTYDWNNILDRYEEGKYTQKQADAIALLSSDCGISVNMRYGAYSSGAKCLDQAIAMADYFGYDRGLQMLFRDFYTLEEITLILKQELAEGRPVLISGYNKNGGHAFVIDGYDERDWFHTCWGNPGGDDNTYTYLPNMVPYQPEWYDPQSPENGMNYLQMFIIGLMPEVHEKATGIERHNFAFQYLAAITDSIRQEPKYEREDVKITVHDMSNMGWNLLNDSVSLMLQKDGKIVCPIHTYTHDFVLEEVDDSTYTDSLSVSIPKDVADGTYTIVPMFRDNALDGGKEWREAKTTAGTPNYLIATIKENDVTLSSDTASTAYLTLEDFDIPDMLINATAPDYSIRLKNHGPEMAGRLFFLMESLDEGGHSFYLQYQGITIGADEEYEIHNKLSQFWAPQVGTYRLHIFYDGNLFADELIELELPKEYIITIIQKSSIQIAMR